MFKLARTARLSNRGSHLVRCSGVQAATTLIVAAFRDRGLRRITISTSWLSAVNRFIRRSTKSLQACSDAAVSEAWRHGPILHIFPRTGSNRKVLSLVTVTKRLPAATRAG